MGHELPRGVGLLVVALVVAACGTPATPPQPRSAPTAGPSEISVVGTITEESTVDPVIDFTLADGQQISVDKTKVRVAVRRGGEPRLLVLGSDEEGGWMAVLGHQDGTPADCLVLNGEGYELGSGIAVFGILWSKAPGVQRRRRRPHARPRLSRRHPILS